VFLQYAPDPRRHGAFMTEPQTYPGSCHCGAVRFEVTMTPPEKAFACNCSICSRAGYLLAFVPRDAVRVLSGEEAQTDYQFGKKIVHHLFCRTCGVRSFSHGTDREGKPTAAINMRCLTGIDPTKLPIHTFDGASL
jgi:hypothetical protein